MSARAPPPSPLGPFPCPVSPGLGAEGPGRPSPGPAPSCSAPAPGVRETAFNQSGGTSDYWSILLRWGVSVVAPLVLLWTGSFVKGYPEPKHGEVSVFIAWTCGYRREEVIPID